MLVAIHLADTCTTQYEFIVRDDQTMTSEFYKVV